MRLWEVGGDVSACRKGCQLNQFSKSRRGRGSASHLAPDGLLSSCGTGRCSEPSRRRDARRSKETHRKAWDPRGRCEESTPRPSATSHAGCVSLLRRASRRSRWFAAAGRSHCSTRAHQALSAKPSLSRVGELARGRKCVSPARGNQFSKSTRRLNLIVRLRSGRIRVESASPCVSL